LSKKWAKSTVIVTQINVTFKYRLFKNTLLNLNSGHRTGGVYQEVLLSITVLSVKISTSISQIHCFLKLKLKQLENIKNRQFGFAFENKEKIFPLFEQILHICQEKN